MTPRELIGSAIEPFLGRLAGVDRAAARAAALLLCPTLCHD